MELNERKTLNRSRMLLACFCVLGSIIVFCCSQERTNIPDWIWRPLTEEQVEHVIARNSPLTEFVCMSPNADFPRKGELDSITIHYELGGYTLERRGELFGMQDYKQSANYVIDRDGKIGLFVEEANASHLSDYGENDNRTLNIEVASDTLEGEWPVNDTVYAVLVDLCVDICERNGIEELRYTGDTTGNLLTHDMFEETDCPGPYLKSRMELLATEVNLRLEHSRR